MAKGMSPLRLFMRNAPRKTVADGIDGSSSGPDGTAQSRQPLGPIAETLRNPLITVAEQSSGDPSTPRARAKVSSHVQEKFPHLENSEVSATSINAIPHETASSQSKGKFTWQHRHGATAQNPPRDGPPSLNTPGCSDGQAANNQDTFQSVSHHLRGCSSGVGSVQSTPKTGSSVGGKSTTESGNGSSQSQNITPCISVPRSLKYSQQGSANNSGASGLTNVRSAVSQHVVNRPMGYLQAVKGVVPQTTNQNFVEHHFEMEEDTSFRRNHNVQVIIRTRPLSNTELTSQGSNRCLKQESPHVVSWLGQPESRFTFDHVAGETITQAKLFDVAGLPMVENCMSGYNSCMFAYGQTGSGKTHTMLGDIENLDRSPSENRGMTPRVFEYLFARIRTEQECRRHEHLKYFCKCSFLEIYNEQITDLLEPSSTNLQMREDAKKGVYVENLSEVEVQCVQDVIQLLLQGSANRKVAATNMNRESSRSHSVFTCVVESKWENNSMTNSRYGRLHLVDLAGSERQKSSGAEGGRLKEAANINKSLSTLGLVIMILVDVANGKQRHVPYRDSKLTFLLQDSLGGNSKTIMIANVSPASCCAMETLSTLKFARRAKFIRNNAIINEDASGDVMALRQEIEELKVEVERLRRERMLRVSSSRILALDNVGSVAGQVCGDKSDASTLDCNVIEGSTFDSRTANKSQTVSIANNVKQLRSIEAVLAGALRREQQAEAITKKLAAEIEQLNRLVRQREEDSQCSNMMLRFREEKIRRLEGIADNVISAETFYEDERKNLIDELQLIRGRLDRNPELTRFAVENIRLIDELRRYQEFYDGGERDVLLEEISGLRSQVEGRLLELSLSAFCPSGQDVFAVLKLKLLDMLDTKVGQEQTIGKLLTPQKRALVPALSALERENKLLLIEVKSYQYELKECRNNLNSCLVANADLSRQLDELQDTVKLLKNERSSRKYEESRELLVSLDEEPLDRFFSGGSLHVTQEAISSADPTSAHIRLEMEELDLQQRQAVGNVDEQVLELRNQLKETQDLLQKLSSEVEEANELSDRRKLKEDTSRVAEDDPVVRKGLQDRWEKLQEIEMRHSEGKTQLQLELDSMEDVLKEERHQRLLADQKIDDLSSQLSATVSKLEQAQGLAEDRSKEERQQRLVAEKRSEELSSQLSAAVSKLEEAHCVVEALEGQQLFSINELENLQSEHTKLLRKLRQHEEGEVELQKQFQDENTLDDGVVSILEKKLLRTKRGEEEARLINRQFQQENASRIALDKEREVIMSEVETQAALVITTLQSEILELREKVSLSVESEVTAKLQISHLEEEVKSLQRTIGQLGDINRYLSDKSDEYRNLVDERNAELQGLEVNWESSASKLIDFLSEGDKALSEAVREMEEIKQTKIQEIPRMVDDHVVEKRETAESVYHRLQGVQLVTETEGEVRTLTDAKTTETTTAAFEDGEAMIRGSEKKSMVAFLMVRELLERIRDLKSAQHRLIQENQEAFLREASKDIQVAALQKQLEELHRQYGELQDEHELVIEEREDLREENRTSSLQLETGNQLKADCIRLDKEVQESCRAVEEKDVENRNLQRQLNENHAQSTLMCDRYRLLAAAHGNLQQEQARYLEDNSLKVKEWEELVRLSERKAMAVLVVGEQLLGDRNDVKASNMGLAKEIQDGRLLLAEKETALDTLEHKLEQSAHQSKELLAGIKSLTVAVEELELEKCRLVFAASQAEMRCTEKEQELFATQGDLAGLRSKLMEVELHEKSLSRQMEELTGAKLRLEVERADAKSIVEEMRQEKDRIRFDLTYVNAEVEERERAIFDSFRRSQQALEKAEARLITVEQELGGLEMSRRNLENDLGLLDSAATVSSTTSEEKEHKYLQMQRRVENAEVQMYEMQAVADSVMAQVLLERDNWESNKRRMMDENEARENELRDEIATAQLKLVAREGSLKVAVKNVEDLGFSIRELEEEILKLNDDAEISLLKVSEQQHEIDTLRGMSMALNAECTEADDSIAALNHFREQYILAEASRRSEQELLTRKLEELEVSAGQTKSEKVSNEVCGVSKSTGQLTQSLPECIPVSEDQKYFEEAHQSSRQEQEIQVLRAKISQKDGTILSAKQQMQIAIANLKEAELEMDKVHRENHRLTQIQLDNKSLIESLSLKFKTTKEELLKRDIKIEGCEAELQKVVGIMSDWETKMLDEEIEWKKGKEALAQELTEANLIANEKRTEAGALLQKFQDGQATLKEAEDLVDALVKANENAKHDALDWKTEKESLEVVQEWWMPDRDKLVSKIARLETNMHTQTQDIWIMCNEEVNGLVATMDLLLVVDKELSELKNDHQHDLDHLAVEMKGLKGDLVAGLLDLEDQMMKSFEDMQTVVYELTSKKYRALKDIADLKAFKEQRIAQSLQTTSSELKAVENESDKYLIVLNEQLEMARTLADEREIVAAEASQAAERSNSHAEEKEEEARILERSVEELESTVYALESQLDIVKRESERQRVAREPLEKELEALKREMGLMQVTIDTQEAQTARDIQGAETLKTELDRIGIEMKNQEIQARKSVESLQQECIEKDVELRSCKAHIAELMLGAEKQVSKNQRKLDIVKRESERQRVAREPLEKELEALKREMGLMQVTIDTQEAQTVRDIQGAETLKTELDRIVIQMKNQQIQARESVESLQQECAEKDVQLRSCKAHIAELMVGAEKQASEHQQKLKTLEAMVEHLKVEERKVNHAGGSFSKAVEKSTGKAKGAGSPFKCIGSGLEKQRSSEKDEDLSTAKKRIKELETVAASRQKEVFMLNTKLAEAESMTHDVVRDLLGVKMDIASYATLLNQQEVQRKSEQARRHTKEDRQKEDELDTLRYRLNEFIEERESWLEEINRKQADAVAAWVSADKLRLRDETLTAENNKFREDNRALRQKVADLDDEIKKLSEQQNLQQRIHHHAKIKEENHSIRFQNEDLNGKLRRMEILFTRVNDELARYRTAEGKSPFLNFDEEARLQKKLQETEENRLQLAETLIGLCTGIMQAAGIQSASKDLDPSAAKIALHQLQDRLESLERELSDCKLKARIAVEKRRLSDLRDFHTPPPPVKAICSNYIFTANQQLLSPVSSPR